MPHYMKQCSTKHQSRITMEVGNRALYSRRGWTAVIANAMRGKALRGRP